MKVEISLNGTIIKGKWEWGERMMMMAERTFSFLKWTFLEISLVRRRRAIEGATERKPRRKKKQKTRVSGCGSGTSTFRALDGTWKLNTCAFFLPFKK